MQEYVGKVVDAETKEDILKKWARDHPNDPSFYVMSLSKGWLIALLDTGSQQGRFLLELFLLLLLLLLFGVGGVVKGVIVVVIIKRLLFHRLLLLLLLIQESVVGIGLFFSQMLGFGGFRG